MRPAVRHALAAGDVEHAADLVVQVLLVLLLLVLRRRR
jgi:ATP/maltotriose-dependent transcriptional regulator MalT